MPPQDADSKPPTDAEARQLREAAALRENLRRRKDQSRARQKTPEVPPDPE